MVHLDYHQMVQIMAKLNLISKDAYFGTCNLSSWKICCGSQLRSYGPILCKLTLMKSCYCSCNNYKKNHILVAISEPASISCQQNNLAGVVKCS